MSDCDRDLKAGTKGSRPKTEIRRLDYCERYGLDPRESKKPLRPCFGPGFETGGRLVSMGEFSKCLYSFIPSVRYF